MHMRKTDVKIELGCWNLEYTVHWCFSGRFLLIALRNEVFTGLNGDISIPLTLFLNIIKKYVKCKTNWPYIENESRYLDAVKSVIFGIVCRSRIVKNAKSGISTEIPFLPFTTQLYFHYYYEIQIEFKKYEQE